MYLKNRCRNDKGYIRDKKKRKKMHVLITAKREEEA